MTKYDADEIVERIFELLGDPARRGRVIECLIKEFGFPSTSSARTYLSRLRNKGVEVPDLRELSHWEAATESRHRDQAATVVFRDKKKAERIDFREFTDLAARRQQFHRRMEDTQRLAEVKVTTDKPFAVVFSGDWHLGCNSVDYGAWLRDIETILRTPNLFLVDLGDDRQNARSFRHLQVVLDQVLSPQEQAEMMRSVVDELTAKGRLLAKVDGNHDVTWDERVFGEALQRYLTERMKAPRFRNRGLVRLKLKRLEYTLLLFHKSRYRSFLRAAHGAMREYKEHFPADVVAGAHDHQVGLEVYEHYRFAREAGYPFGGRSYLLKVGTYQDSDYGWKYWGNEGKPFTPVIVFWPDRHKMEAFMEIQDAITFMRALQNF